LVIYHTKYLCHYIKYILFYFWLKYGTIWTNIINFVESISMKLCNETRFLNHLSKHLRTCFNHLNKKKLPPFLSRYMWVSNEKKISHKHYFVNVVVIQSSVPTMILGRDNYPFIYPNHECTHPYQMMEIKRIKKFIYKK